MDYEIGDSWGTLLVLGWLLSPIVFIVATMIVLVLAELRRRLRLTGSIAKHPALVTAEPTPSRPR